MDPISLVALLQNRPLYVQQQALKTLGMWRLTARDLI